MTSPASQDIPGYAVGTWDIDPMHSEVSFTVRHLMVSKVRGRFGRFQGTVETRENVADSEVAVTVDAASVDTGEPQRDEHVRSADFFDVENHPEWSFRSTGLRAGGDAYQLDGDLTIKGTTRPVTFALEVNGFGPDGMGGHRAGFSASTTVDRNDFGVDIRMPLDGGGVVLSDKVQVNLEIAAALRQP
ncbi:polyisoprenoid-binding protein [Streptomyces armeniacus]|uniref:Polyisoprenoid-binding protein n=1 Tax=Streptomyces armeniacus TaxID=83291 RepID=A0A345XWU3_9ACTN|nr:YceI family protein [Streptomyces armeniacus]AXK36109.1 polyisoprenoid-binding protein [Streptomyces armeniacus]